MFSDGSILYFTPFKFRDGSTPKNKYFIILKTLGNNLIVASLPSSQLYLPSSLSLNTNCIHVPDADIGAYIFEDHVVIGQNGFAFPKRTILYGQYIEAFDTSLILNQYPIKDIDFSIVDTLKPSILDEVINCFTNAVTVKRKIKALLK
ncbi:hypothetical protein EP331_08930 [bacterium]|nr:MAG: hypothetical protein EP331_08930 [bacterium]